MPIGQLNVELRPLVKGLIPIDSLAIGLIRVRFWATPFLIERSLETSAEAWHQKLADRGHH